MTPAVLTALRILPPPRDRRGRGHSAFLVNPAYAAMLRRADLTRPEDFLRLREEIVSGHPDRQVSRIVLGAGLDAVPAFLKREHRVPWKERLANWWQGFGLASKSWREARVLQSLRADFDACPEWIAAAELADGQAFLIVREVTGAVPLPRCPDTLRRAVARRLGRTLAEMHSLGVAHGDLYANHVLVHPRTLAITFLDWQRAIRVGRLSPRQRWRDLAAIMATLPPGLAATHDCFACLATYLSHAGDIPVSLRQAFAAVQEEVRRLRKERHVRTKALPGGKPQSLVCRDGNALRITPEFQRLWPIRVPDFLRGTELKSVSEVRLPDGGIGRLSAGCHHLPWYRQRGPWRRTWTSPQRVRMGLLFRLERRGIEAPRVLAEGERPGADGTVEAFLLTRVPERAVPLEPWLASCREDAQREPVARLAGAFLARLHAAGCFFRAAPAGLGVQDLGEPKIVLLDAAGLVVRRRWQGLWKRRDLWKVRRLVRAAGVSEGYWGAGS